MVDRRIPQALSAGRVGRPHGLDGGFYVTRARPRLLEPGMRVTIGAHTHEIARRSGVAERPIVNLRAVNDRGGAEALRGLELLVGPADAPPLQAGEWWAHELQGCEVHSASHRSLGTVAGLLELPSCEVLQVALPDGGELLVPMVKDAIRDIDVAARRIEVDLEFLGESGAHETRAGETGAHETRARESGAHETRARESGAHETRARESGTHESGTGESDAHETGAHQSGAHETGAGESGAHETGARDPQAGNP